MAHMYRNAAASHSHAALGFFHAIPVCKLKKYWIKNLKHNWMAWKIRCLEAYT